MDRGKRGGKAWRRQLRYSLLGSAVIFNDEKKTNVNPIFFCSSSVYSLPLTVNWNYFEQNYCELAPKFTIPIIARHLNDGEISHFNFTNLRDIIG